MEDDIDKDSPDPSLLLDNGPLAEGHESARESVRSRLFGGGDSFDANFDNKSGLFPGLSEEQRQRRIREEL